MAKADGVELPGNQGAGAGPADPPPRAQPQSQPTSDAAEAQRMAARLQHHLAYGAVARAARSLATTPPEELNEDTIGKLHALHPAEEKPTPPFQMPDALQID